MSWASKNKERASQQQRARHLIVIKAMTLREVSKIVEVSETTLVTWSKKYGWKTAGIAFRENETKKEHAFRLVVLDGVSQKEVAKRIGVSERTIVQWKKEEVWQALLQIVNNKSKGMLPLFIGYIKYVQKHCPDIAFRAECLLHEYILKNEDFDE